MKRLLISAVVGAAALVAGIAVAVASTGGSQASAQNGGAPVSDKLIRGAGRVLVDSKGRALYVNDQERRGMVLCTGACLSFWTPLTISGPLKSGVFSGKLAVLKRPDGRGRSPTRASRSIRSSWISRARSPVTASTTRSAARSSRGTSPAARGSRARRGLRRAARPPTPATSDSGRLG